MQLQGTMGSSVRYPAVLKVAMTQSKRQQGQEDDCVALYDEDSSRDSGINQENPSPQLWKYGSAWKRPTQTRNKQFPLECRYTFIKHSIKHLAAFAVVRPPLEVGEQLFFSFVSTRFLKNYFQGNEFRPELLDGCGPRVHFRRSFLQIESQQSEKIAKWTWERIVPQLKSNPIPVSFLTVEKKTAPLSVEFSVRGEPLNELGGVSNFFFNSILSFGWPSVKTPRGSSSSHFRNSTWLLTQIPSMTILFRVLWEEFRTKSNDSLNGYSSSSARYNLPAIVF